MIKFFRKIRQSLLSENKFSKYLIYAVGEIILVVIGILIALQINNNNEAKNNEALLVKILKELRQDLETDLITAQQRLVGGEEIDSLCKLILNQKVTKQDYIEEGFNIDLFWTGLQFSNFDFQKTAFNKFENFQGIIPEKHDGLIKDINNYYNVTGKLHNDRYSNLRQQIKDRHDYLANNTDWYYLFRNHTHTPEMLDFFINSSIYKNWIVQHKGDNINGKSGTVKLLQDQAFVLIYRLTKVLQDNYQINDTNIIEKFGVPRTDDLSDYSGYYTTDKFNRTIEIFTVNGHLFADRWHMKSIEKDSFTSWTYPDFRYVFKRNGNNIIGLEMTHLKDSTRNAFWKKRTY